MRKIWIFISILFLGTVYLSRNAFAFEVGSQETEITVTSSYVSRYIWRGQDLYGNNDSAQQASIDISFPNLVGGADISLNLWGSFPLNKGHEDSEELNYTITFFHEISKLFNLSGGYTYFDFPNTAKTTDVGEPWAALTLNKIPGLPLEVSMVVFAGYDFKVASGGPDEGWYYSWGFDTELPLPQLSLFQEGKTVTFSIINWGNDGVTNLEPSTLYATEFNLLAEYSIGEYTISPSIHYVLNHQDKINSGDDELWFGIEISYAF